MTKSFPPKTLQNEIRNLLLRAGIPVTRALMNRVKKLSIAEAERARGILYRVAIATEHTRQAHPDGRRSTTRQLVDWEGWMATLGQEITPDVLAIFLNLDTKAANSAIMQLRWLFWGQRDAKGKTSELRTKRGLVTSEYRARPVDTTNATRDSRRVPHTKEVPVRSSAAGEALNMSADNVEEVSKDKTTATRFSLEGELRQLGGALLWSDAAPAMPLEMIEQLHGTGDLQAVMALHGAGPCRTVSDALALIHELAQLQLTLKKKLTTVATKEKIVTVAPTTHGQGNVAQGGRRLTFDEL